MKYLLPLLLITFNAFSQKRIQHFVQSNAAAIQSIDPLDTSFAALNVLDKAIERQTGHYAGRTGSWGCNRIPG